MADGINFVCQIDSLEGARRLIAPKAVDGYTSCAGAMTRLSYMERLREINLRTRLIYGAHDLGTPPAGMHEMAKRIPNATYLEINPAGHLSNIENPTPFNTPLFPILDSFNRPAA
jgi:3-oxoadipate enol-lactonase